MADLDYLRSDFDYHACTKPQLRSILADVGLGDSLPAASAKKEVLVELFEREVAAKRDAIVRARSKVRASDKGILLLDNDSKPSPQRKASGTRSARSSSPARPSPRGAAKTTVPSQRKAARSPSVRRQSPSPKPSSAAKELRSASRARQQKASSSAIATPEAKRTASFSLLDSPLALLQRALPSYSDSPRSVLMKLHNHLRDTMQQQQQQSVPARSFRKLQAKAFLARLATALCTMAAIAVAALWLRWKFLYPFPYCDASAVSTFSLKALHADPVKAINECCLSCPLHGICRGGRLVCQEGFIAVSNLITFGSTCQPDQYRLRQVEDLAKKASAALASLSGLAVCSGSPTPYSMTNAELSEYLQSQHPEALWTAKWSECWPLAVREFRREPRHNVAVSSIEVGGGEMVVFASTRPFLAIRCRVRLFLRQWYLQHRLLIWTVAIGFVAAFYALLSIKRTQRLQVFVGRRVEDQKVLQLTHAIFKLLAEQDALNRRNPTVPSTIAINQLRDAFFLTAGPSSGSTGAASSTLRERDRVWPRVCHAIARNSSVRESVMSFKGEQQRVWEWIGADILTDFAARRESLFAPSTNGAAEESMMSSFYPRL